MSDRTQEIQSAAQQLMTDAEGIGVPEAQLLLSMMRLQIEMLAEVHHELSRIEVDTTEINSKLEGKL